MPKIPLITAGRGPQATQAPVNVGAGVNVAGAGQSFATARRQQQAFEQQQAELQQRQQKRFDVLQMSRANQDRTRQYMELDREFLDADWTDPTMLQSWQERAQEIEAASQDALGDVSEEARAKFGEASGTDFATRSLEVEKTHRVAAIKMVSGEWDSQVNQLVGEANMAIPTTEVDDFIAVYKGRLAQTASQFEGTMDDATEKKMFDASIGRLFARVAQSAAREGNLAMLQAIRSDKDILRGMGAEQQGMLGAALNTTKAQMSTAEKNLAGLERMWRDNFGVAMPADKRQRYIESQLGQRTPLERVDQFKAEFPDLAANMTDVEIGQMTGVFKQPVMPEIHQKPIKDDASAVLALSAVSHDLSVGAAVRPGSIQHRRAVTAIRHLTTDIIVRDPQTGQEVSRRPRTRIDPVVMDVADELGISLNSYARRDGTIMQGTAPRPLSPEQTRVVDEQANEAANDIADRQIGLYESYRRYENVYSAFQGLMHSSEILSNTVGLVTDLFISDEDGSGRGYNRLQFESQKAINDSLRPLAGLGPENRLAEGYRTDLLRMIDNANIGIWSAVNTTWEGRQESTRSLDKAFAERMRTMREQNANPGIALKTRRANQAALESLENLRDLFQVPYSVSAEYDPVAKQRLIEALKDKDSVITHRHVGVGVSDGTPQRPHAFDARDFEDGSAESFREYLRSQAGVREGDYYVVLGYSKLPRRIESIRIAQ